ncbi:methyltransferase [Flexithrix dorotheae]|uniref:methyltransferase n=1 Tax=Flexithrix dorotheae TaxID=70993 RepID=UPI00035EF815|nr:methyltransferase [Flexithrix dorotheae]
MHSLFQNLLFVELAFAVIAFGSLMMISAPYGKFIRPGWGIGLKAKFAWLIMEFPAFLIISAFFLLGKGWENPVLIIFLIIWQSHYFHRTFIYPFQMRGKNKDFPFLLVLFALTFNYINGFINGYDVFLNKTYPVSWLYSPNFLAGLFIFILGYFINKQSDNILKNLRTNQEKDYKIPYGGLFSKISNPHYFGEILEWGGWAILTWSPAGLAFFIFTMGNLLPRAIQNHKWYRENFADYPTNRKILIPYIF